MGTLITLFLLASVGFLAFDNQRQERRLKSMELRLAQPPHAQG